MNKEKRKRKSYSKEFKLKVIRMYYDEYKGIKTIAKELGFKYHKTIRNWLKKYDEYGEAGLEKERGRPKKGYSLKEENRRLRLENEILKKTAEYFKEKDRLDLS